MHSAAVKSQETSWFSNCITFKNSEFTAAERDAVS